MPILETVKRKVMGNKPSEDAIKKALSKVVDPDLHVDIVTLGFVKKISIGPMGKVDLRIQLTTPACPAKDMMGKQIEEEVGAIPGVSGVNVEFTADTTRSRSKLNPDVMAALGQVKNIIAVASGKGGVGKSTSTVNLAYALADSGSKVGILDADVHGPSVPLMTGAKDPTEVHGKMIVPPEVGGVKIISVGMFNKDGKANIMRGPMTSQIIRQFLTQISWGELDYLLIDYPPGTGDIQLTLSQMAPLSGAVLVTTPQEVALLDVRKAVEMFASTKVPILGVVETMSYFVCDGCEKRHPIFKEGGGQKVAEEHGVKLLGSIPMEMGVSECGDSGRPIVSSAPNSASAKAYREASGKVAAQLSILNSQAGEGLVSFNLDWK